MIFKTIVAGTIAAMLAGGIVYFSTPPAENGGSVELRGTISAAQSDPAPESLKDRIMRRFLTSDSPAGDNAPEPNGQDNDQDAAQDGDQDTTNDTPQSTEAAAPGPSDESNTDESKEVQYFRLENGEFTEIKAPPKFSLSPSFSAQDSINPAASARIIAAMDQAQKIMQPDLRNRAYLQVVDFALSEDLFTPARSAIEMIEQSELRDTARARIAVAYAAQGDSDNAFTLIDAVEVSELRDIMRLQVIETLIPPRQSSSEIDKQGGSESFTQ